MNNRYIFRGKRKDNKEWVEGDLIQWKNGNVQICLGVGTNKEQKTLVDVIPETVGQCTGLKDKNSKLIFEGDIIRTKEYGRVIAHSTVSDYDIFRITYVPAMFRIENIHRAFNLVGNSADCEVIGNIHDNPELFEVEK